MLVTIVDGIMVHARDIGMAAAYMPSARSPSISLSMIWSILANVVIMSPLAINGQQEFRSVFAWLKLARQRVAIEKRR